MELASLPYENQLNIIVEDFFGVFASYVQTFRKMGVDASLLIPNCKPLQKTWAKENNVEFSEKNWLFNIPLHQIKRIKPDIFYLSSMFEYYGNFLDEVRSMTKKICGWISCVIPRGTRLNQFHLIFSSIPHFIDDFRRSGIPSEYLNAAFNPEILKVLSPVVNRDLDFTFIGSLTPYHQNRIILIRELAEKTDLQLYGIGYDKITNKKNIFYRILPKSKLKYKVRGQVWGLDMFRTLQRSRITFNSHIDISNTHIGNLRMYEATGMGTLLLTDGKYAPRKIFNDDEVVYYESIDDAIDKVKYYTENEEERSRIAINGQKRTLSEYNYEITSRKMYDYFINNL